MKPVRACLKTDCSDNEALLCLLGLASLPIWQRHTAAAFTGDGLQPVHSVAPGTHLNLDDLAEIAKHVVVAALADVKVFVSSGQHVRHIVMLLLFVSCDNTSASCECTGVILWCPGGVSDCHAGFVSKSPFRNTWWSTEVCQPTAAYTTAGADHPPRNGEELNQKR